MSVRDLEEADAPATGPAGGGAVIEDVREDGPAARAGFAAGDVVVEFDGERVRSARQFTRLVQETPPGRQVRATVIRGGERVTLTVAPAEGGGVRVFGDLGEMGRRFNLELLPPAEPPSPPEAPRPPRMPDFEWLFGGAGRLGVSVDEMTPQLAEYFGVKEGVLIRSVTEGSSAARAGLRAGDVVVAMNGRTVRRAQDLRGAIRDADDGGVFELEVVRDRKQIKLKGELEPLRERRRGTTTL